MIGSELIELDVYAQFCSMLITKLASLHNFLSPTLRLTGSEYY